MIYCANCGLANRDGARYCNECGMRLGASLPCPSCGEPNLSPSRFCNFCGIRLSADARPGPSVASDLAASTQSTTETDEDIAETLALEASSISGAPQLDQAVFQPPAVEVVTVSLPVITDGNALGEPEILVDKGPDDSEAPDPNQPAVQASEEGEQFAQQQTGAAGSTAVASGAANPVDDLLPSWLLESDKYASGPADALAVVIPKQDGVMAGDRPEPAQAWELHATPALPWERPDGIVVARSVAKGYSVVRFEELREPDANGGTQFLAAHSSAWQPFSIETAVRPAAKPPRIWSGAGRRILSYLLIAALVALVAVLASNSEVAARTGSVSLEPVGAFFFDVGAFLYRLVAQRPG